MELENFIGIDVSKSSVDVACYQEEQPVLCGKFENSQKGFDKMVRWIKMQTDCSLEKWLVCFEHIGVYGWSLGCYLSEKKIKYSVQSALHIKRSLGIQRGKNDNQDARAIARFAYLHRKEIKLTTLPSKTLISLRNLLSYRRH